MVWWIASMGQTHVPRATKKTRPVWVTEFATFWWKTWILPAKCRNQVNIGQHYNNTFKFHSLSAHLLHNFITNRTCKLGILFFINFDFLTIFVRIILYIYVRRRVSLIIQFLFLTEIYIPSRFCSWDQSFFRNVNFDDNIPQLIETGQHLLVPWILEKSLLWVRKQ